MRKGLALALTLVFMLLCAPAALAQAAPDYEYSVRDDGMAVITKYAGSGGDITLPDTIDGHTVAEIGDYAFGECDNLTSVTLPYTITVLGDGVFTDCKKLVSAAILGPVESIGLNPFLSCTSLTEVKLPENGSTLQVSGSALILVAEKRLVSYFLGSAAQEYAVPAGVEVIGADAFADSALKRIVLPFGVETIETYAFTNTKAQSILIPDSVTSIADDSSVFGGADGLTLMVGEGSHAMEFAQKYDIAAKAVQPFTFRKGVTWASTQEDVTAAETPSEPDTSEMYGLKQLMYSQVPVSKYEGGLAYIFKDDSLLLIGYNIEASGDEQTQMLDYMTSALSEKYGAVSFKDDDWSKHIVGYVSTLSSEGTEMPAILRSAGWMLPDGTLITLVGFESNLNLLLYGNLPRISPQALNMNGL